LRRYHGGAAASLGRSYEPPFKSRSTKHQPEKAAIGKEAAALVIDGDSIALDVGTTTLEIVPGLAGKRNLTVVTSCLPIASLVVSEVALEVAARLIVTGGIVRPGELSMIGRIPEQVYHDFHVDKAFIGTAGISLEDGLTEYNIEDAQIKQVLIRGARERIVVADGSKFGKTTFVSVAPLDAIDKIVTDRSAPLDILEEIRGRDVEVIVAD
jgi:DeoR/GlpR family transcriptional regulator of sugar metabolism